jgi:hypothetical protein
LFALGSEAEGDVQLSIPIQNPVIPQREEKIIAQPTPRPIKIGTSRPAVYVLVAVDASEPTIANALAVEVAMRVAPNLAALAPTPSNEPGPMILPEPTWTIDDLAEQCRFQPHSTRGAIIVGPLENDSGIWNAFVYENGYTRLTAGAFLVTCEESKLSVSWASSHLVQGRWQQGGIPLLPIGLLATYFIGHSGSVAGPFTLSTNHGPQQTTGNQNVGGTISTTTTTPGAKSSGNGPATPAPSTVSTTVTAPSANGSTQITTGGNAVQTTSAQTTTSNTALAASMGSIFEVSSTFADRAYPVSPQAAQTTFLKHAAGRLADDLFRQLKKECSGTAACGTLFAAAPPVNEPAPAGAPPSK